VRFFVF